jgi:outer membrane protein assembly factor BamA
MLRRVACALAAFSLGIGFPVSAQVGNFEGRRIVDIQYSPTVDLDPADLAAAQPLKKGDPLQTRDVAAAIDALFATGRFKDVSIEGEPSGDGVLVRIITKPQWFVGGIAVEGGIPLPPNRAELRGSTLLTLGAPFREEDVKGAVDRMSRLLRNNGLYESAVEPRIERSDDAQQVFITFQIRPGKRAKYDEPRIQGEPMLSDATILRVTGWRLPIIHWWRKVTAARTRGGVQKLQKRYGKDDRLLARVELHGEDYDASVRRVSPKVEVSPGPKVKIETVEAKVSKRVLKRYVPVYDERSVDTDLLVEGKRNLQDYFQSQGYYDADVDFRLQPRVDDSQVIQYVISKGERFRLARLTITGNKYFNTETIRERMFIAPSGLFMRRGRYSEAFRRKDEATIGDLYKANGFHDVTVATTVQRDYQGKAGDVAVDIHITEGRQWLVGKLTVNGIPDGQRAQALTGAASVAGQPFSEVTLATDRTTVLTWFYTHGYPDATLKAQWQMSAAPDRQSAAPDRQSAAPDRQSAAPDRVDVTYTISPGKQQVVRDVLISGLHTTRPSLIDHNMTMKPGDPLSPVDQTDLQKRFYDLGIFSNVDTAIQNADGTTDHKFVLYNFEEANRYTLNLGFGAQVARFGQPSSQSLGNPAGTTGFSPEGSLSLSRLNFLGLGHSVTLHAVYSSIDKLGSVTYLQPHFLNSFQRTLTYTVLYNEELDVRTFASKREEASVQLSQKFSKSLTGLFRLAYRRVSVSNVVIPVLLIPQLTQPVRIGIISGNLVQDRRNNQGNPTRGMLNSLDIGIADKVLGSERNFLRVLVRNATYYKLTSNLILARRTQFGIIAPFGAPAGLTNQESVPLPERFFAGGADSLRSFAFNEAGPRDTGAPLVPGGPSSQPTGFPLGGNALFINNIELRFPLIGQNIQGVFFHDMGNVFSSVSDISFRYKQRDTNDFNYTTQAPGFGIRYRTPVGPVRADLAYTLNPPSFFGFSGTPQQILQCNPNDPVSLQQSFCKVTRQSTGHLQFFFSIGQTF